MSKKILIINQDDTMEVPFEQQITIGRDVHNELSLQDAEISRTHAIVFETGSVTLIKDLSSRNGIFVNGEQVIEKPLARGDEIILGSTIMIFDPPEGARLNDLLSERGAYLIEHREERSDGKGLEPVNIYSCEQLDRMIKQLLNSSEDETSFFTIDNAMKLLKTVHDMGHVRDTSDLFRVALDHAVEIVGGDHGIVMEANAKKEKLKVRSLYSLDDEDSAMEISRQILRVVLRAERGVFCPNVGADRQFAKMLKGSETRPVRSFVASPIRTEKNYFGFMYLHSEDPEVQYDFTSLRSLYFTASHLAALLEPKKTRFKHAQLIDQREAAGFVAP